MTISAEIISLSKRCVSCGDNKPLDSFYMDRSRTAMGNKKSRYNKCKECFEKRRGLHDIFSDSSPAMLPLRECRVCHEQKPLFSFRKTKHSKMGRTNDCKECYNKYRYGTEEKKKKCRDSSRKYRRNISATDFNIMFASQNGKCAVCKTDMEFLAKDTCIDHNHKTGEIREIVCGRCNLGLGHFHDDTENMRLAIAYLEKHNDKKE